MAGSPWTGRQSHLLSFLLQTIVDLLFFSLQTACDVLSFPLQTVSDVLSFSLQTVSDELSPSLQPTTSPKEEGKKKKKGGGKTVSSVYLVSLGELMVETPGNILHLAQTPFLYWNHTLFSDDQTPFYIGALHEHFSLRRSFNILHFAQTPLYI